MHVEAPNPPVSQVTILNRISPLSSSSSFPSSLPCPFSSAPFRQIPRPTLFSQTTLPLYQALSLPSPSPVVVQPPLLWYHTWSIFHYHRPSFPTVLGASLDMALPRSCHLYAANSQDLGLCPQEHSCSHHGANLQSDKIMTLFKCHCSSIAEEGGQATIHFCGFRCARSDFVQCNPLSGGFWRVC